MDYKHSYGQPPSSKLYILGVLLLVAVFIATYLFTKQISTISLVKNGPFTLTSPTSAVTSSDFPSITAANQFLKNGTGTFQCFVYLDSLSKSGGAVGCGQPGSPQCSGLFDPCKCATTSDCTNCAHNGYNTLVALYGVYKLEVLTAPDASRPSSVLAQLAVQTSSTVGSTVTNYIETIPLPPLSLQKWTMITIAKEGRRIDIYYNDHLVSSSSMQNMIVVTGDGTIVMTGDIGLSGTMGVVRFDTGRLPVTAVSALYSKLADTRGAPMAIQMDVRGATAAASSNSTAWYEQIVKALCLDGSCLTAPKIQAPTLGDVLSTNPNIPTITVQAPSPIYAVTTEYA